MDAKNSNARYLSSNVHARLFSLISATCKSYVKCEQVAFLGLSQNFGGCLLSAPGASVLPSVRLSATFSTITLSHNCNAH